ncbi:MAG: MoaD/ThiS family protein [Desulfamplus sp.]|nr:MoaD/ThiS family protein [Desulfamplus sp.]
MNKITFNAFSFLQKKLTENGFPFANACLEIPENISVFQLMERLKLAGSDVEGAFVNGLIVPFHTIIQNGDRVGLVPPGTPGPYRVMLGMIKK